MAVRLVGRRLSEAVGHGAQYALRPARRLLNLLDADGGMPAAGRCDRRLLHEAQGRHSPCAVSTALDFTTVTFNSSINITGCSVFCYYTLLHNCCFLKMESLGVTEVFFGIKIIAAFLQYWTP